MRDFTDRALDAACRRGAAYADVRVVDSRSETVNVRRGTPGLSRDTSRGFGVRVLCDGSWGFASSPDLDAEAVEKVAAKAVALARASALCKRHDVVLGQVEPVVATYSTPVKKDPFSVKVEDRAGLLLDIDRLMRQKAGVRTTASYIRCERQDKVFASTEGAYIQQAITEVGASISATAVDGGESQTRSYPNGRTGGHATAGFEFVEGLGLEQEAERVATEAVALLEAEACPSVTTDLILDGSCLALHVHETVGHPIELDRVLGWEISMAGASFLTPNHLGNLEYAAGHVNLTADATIPGGLGSFGYDDEGIPARRVDIVKNGVFVGYLTSRETASLLGQESMGAARATNWNKIPLVRMTNVNLEPGDWTTCEIISDTKQGILMEGIGSGSIDDMRTNFQFGPEMAWEIRDGARGRMYRNPTYTGRTLDFWRNCDAVAGDGWQVWGLPSCGKGQPGQVAHVGHGAAPARFTGVKVGVGQ
ncbi:MAG: TldD/PmbA family protein [Bacillota bacterium]